MKKEMIFFAMIAVVIFAANTVNAMTKIPIADFGLCTSIVEPVFENRYVVSPGDGSDGSVRVFRLGTNVYYYHNNIDDTGRIMTPHGVRFEVWKGKKGREDLLWKANNYFYIDETTGWENAPVYYHHTVAVEDRHVFKVYIYGDASNPEDGYLAQEIEFEASNSIVQKPKPTAVVPDIEIAEGKKTVVINWSTVSGETYHLTILDEEKELVFEKDMEDLGDFEVSLDCGKYFFQVDSTNSAGTTKGTLVEFEVEDDTDEQLPEKVVAEVKVENHQEVSFSWQAQEGCNYILNVKDENGKNIVLENLDVNSYEFTSEEGKFTVQVSAVNDVGTTEGMLVTFEVVDSSDPIDPIDIDVNMERFFLSVLYQPEIGFQVWYLNLPEGLKLVLLADKIENDIFEPGEIIYIADISDVEIFAKDGNGKIVFSFPVEMFEKDKNQFFISIPKGGNAISIPLEIEKFDDEDFFANIIGSPFYVKDFLFNVNEGLFVNMAKRTSIRVSGNIPDFYENSNFRGPGISAIETAEIFPGTPLAAIIGAEGDEFYSGDKFEEIYPGMAIFSFF